MKKLMRKLSKVTDSSSSSQYCALAGDESSGKWSAAVPEGHLPVYVGEEMERFVVSASFLNHPIFVELLNRSAAEYGYQQKGVLRIPCHVFVFERVLEAVRDGGAVGTREMQELLRLINGEL